MNNSSNNNSNSKATSQKVMGITVATRAQPPSPAMVACPPCSSSTLKKALQGPSYRGRPLHALQRMSSYDPLLPLHLGFPPSLNPHRYSHQVPLAPDPLLHGTHMPRWSGPQDRQTLGQMHVAECLWNLENPPPP